MSMPAGQRMIESLESRRLFSVGMINDGTGTGDTTPADNGKGPDGGVPAAQVIYRLSELLAKQGNPAAPALATVLRQSKFSAFYHS